MRVFNPPPATIPPVQTSARQTGSGGMSFTVTVKKGNLLVVAWWINNMVTGISDGVNTWNPLNATVINSTEHFGMWYAVAVSDATITVTNTNTGTNGDYCFVEYPTYGGVVTLDGVGDNVTASATLLTATTTAAFGPSDLVVAGLFTVGGSITNATSGYTQEVSSRGFLEICNKTASASGTQSATWSGGSGNMIGIVANFLITAPTPPNSVIGG